MNRLWKWIALLLVTVCFTGINAQSGDLPAYTPKQIISGQPHTGFGNAIAVNQNTLIVGAPEANNYNGKAFIYIRSNGQWVLQAELVPDSNLANLWFGISVDIKGDTAIVGAPSQGTISGKGAAYVYVRQNNVWNLQTKLQNDNATLFGEDVALGDNTALVRGFKPGINLYSAYGFRRSGSTWNSKGKLTSGSELSMAIHGNTALIGVDNAVEVFTYENAAWIYQAHLTSAATNIRGFGRDISIDGDTAVIGAPLSNLSTGTAHIFRRVGTTWSEELVLYGETDPSQTWGGDFGEAVGISGNNVIVSAPRINRDQGKAYLYSFDGSTWHQVAILTSGNANPALDYFGRDAAIDADEIFVDVWQPYKNAVHVYDITPEQNPSESELLVNGGFETDSNGDFVPDGWTRKNSTGDGRRCNQAGQPAYEGQCTYLFKDDASGNNKLVQNVDLNVHDLNAGDKVKLTGFYNKQSAGSIQVRLFVTYASLPEDQQRITVTAATTGYKALPALAITLKAKPTRVRVQIQNETTSGKTWFDGLSLKLTDNSPAASLIPLP